MARGGAVSGRGRLSASLLVKLYSVTVYGFFALFTTNLYAPGTSSRSHETRAGAVRGFDGSRKTRCNKQGIAMRLAPRL